MAKKRWWQEQQQKNKLDRSRAARQQQPEAFVERRSGLDRRQTNARALETPPPPPPMMPELVKRNPQGLTTERASIEPLREGQAMPVIEMGDRERKIAERYILALTADREHAAEITEKIGHDVVYRAYLEGRDPFHL